MADPMREMVNGAQNADVTIVVKLKKLHSPSRGASELLEKSSEIHSDSTTSARTGSNAGGL